MTRQEILNRVELINRLRENGGTVREHLEAQAVFDQLKQFLTQPEEDDEDTDTAFNTAIDLMRGNGADEVGDGVVDRYADGIPADVCPE